MDEALWHRLQLLFHQALELPPDAREAFVASSCPDDPALAAKLLAMLRHDAGGTSVLDLGAGSVAQELLAHEPGAWIDAAQFLPYRLTTLLGEGGMGVVYLAERSDLGMKVAVKILRDAWLSPARRERFLSEQRTLAQLAHPGIARLYDANTLDDGTPWFVMEYVEGVSLTDGVRLRGSSIAERMALFRSVCEAVQHAHSHGVIHRDLKPSNILLKADGTVRLLDFGIAKQMDPDSSDRGNKTTMAFMTPAYAAPEQFRGEVAGPATDVFALGVVLFELLAGQLPFPQRSRHGTLDESAAPRVSTVARNRSGAQRPEALASAAWADLDTICGTCMAEDPAQRYRSVDALIRDLDHFARQEPLEARPDTLPYTLSKWMRRRWRAVAAALLLLVGGTAAGIVLSPSGTEATGRIPVIAVLPLRNVTGDTALDYLGVGVPNEIALTLAHRRGIAVRPFAQTRSLTSDATGLETAARTLAANSVVMGEVAGSAASPVVRLRVHDAATQQERWRDSITIPGRSRIAMQQLVGNVVHARLAAYFGATLDAPSVAPAPRNEEAYRLYLLAVKEQDAGQDNRGAIEKLERSVALDSLYAPAWFQLGSVYYAEARYHSGDLALLQRARHAAAMAHKVNPEYVEAGIFEAIGMVEQGRVAESFLRSQALLRRRPDVAEVHFVHSYALRFAGLLEESSRECQIALSLTRWRLRSCAVPFLLRGDYDGAEGFLTLDRELDWHRAIRIHMLVRSGREIDALKIAPPEIAQWKSYGALLACAARRPAKVIDSLAALVTPHGDPESNYFAASHLAYCGRSEQALDLLGRAIRGGYCSYPVIETEPYFTKLRTAPAFDSLRQEGAACRARFMAETRS